jgi:chromosome segregation ATPase
MKNLGGYLVGGLLLFAAYRFSKFSDTGEGKLDEDTNTGGADTNTNTETENDNAEAIDSLNEQIDELQEDIITITGDLEVSDSNIGINTEFITDLQTSKQDAGDFLTAADLETYEDSIDTLTESVGTFESSLDTFATKTQVNELQSNVDTLSQDLDGFDMGTITELDNRITENTTQDAVNQSAQNNLTTKVNDATTQATNSSDFIIQNQNSIGLLDGRLNAAESGIGEFNNVLSTKANTSDLDGYLTQADYDMDTLNNDFVTKTEFDDFGEDFNEQLNDLGSYVSDALGTQPVPVNNDASKNFNGGFQDSW